MHAGSLTSTKEDWGDGCPHLYRRSVEWLDEISRDDFSQKMKNSLGSLQTVYSIDEHKEEIDFLLTGERPAKKRKREVSGEELLDATIDRIRDLSPKEFEDFTTHLLEILGFKAATTQYVGDKGIDVIGTLNAEGLVDVVLHVQVKRIKGSIDNKEVLQIRGTLAPGEHGAIITTSRFTKPAEEEADDTKKGKVSLVDGRTLAEMILEHYDELDDKYKALLRLERKDVPIAQRFRVVIGE